MSGVERVMANLHAGQKAVTPAQTAGMQKAVMYLKGRIVRNRLSGPTGDSSLSVRSGRARASVATSVQIIPGGVRGTVGSPVTYLRAHELGSGPYEIRPKNRSVLRFMVAGKAVFARMVHHHGAKARHMFRDETAAQRPILLRLIGHDVAAQVVAKARGR